MLSSKYMNLRTAQALHSRNKPAVEPRKVARPRPMNTEALLERYGSPMNDHGWMSDFGTGVVHSK